MKLFDKFKLKGNRQHLRTDMEMNSLDSKTYAIKEIQ